MSKEINDIISEMLREMSTHAIRRSNLIAAKLGINSTDLEAMEVLLRHGKATAGTMATETGISGGAATKMIDRLEKAGFVKREYDKSDRRKVFIVLNMAYVQESAFPLYQPLALSTNKLLATYSKKELNIISDFLEKALKISDEDLTGLASEA